jgi:superfamily II DNA or RNA helicase
MDTDGFCSKNGKSIIFYSTSIKLVKGVQFIVQSLGGKAVITDKHTYYTYKDVYKAGKNSFAVHISMPKNIIPFRLSRKKDLFSPRTKYPPLKYINKIELVGQKEAKCILIDSEDHLYVTDDFILTHNSLCLALLAAKFNKPTTLYVIGLDLLKQMHDLFTTLFDEPIGYIGDGVCKIERINIATIWTIGSALKIKGKDICLDEDEDYKEKFVESQSGQILSLLKNTKVHLFDECHVIVCNTIKQIYKNIDPEYIYGFSGTPYRDDNTDLLINGMLGEQIIDVSASELIKKGVLAQPLIKFKSIPSMGGLSMAQYQTVYKAYITENIIRNTIIVNETKALIEKKYTPLVLFKQIKHGKILFEMMQEAGIKCEMLSGRDSLKHRTEVKRMIENKEIDAIIASVVFDIGINLPILSALVLAGSGKSAIRSLQRVGRVIRKFKGKSHVAIVDFYDQVKFLKKHSMIRYNIYISEAGFKVIKCKQMK